MNNIKTIIREKGWTIAGVAEKLGTSQSALSQQLINGTLSLSRAQDIADIVGVSLSTLVGDTDKDFIAIIKNGDTLHSARSVSTARAILDEIEKNTDLRQD